jgi:putative ABC transport system permease protein
MRFISIPVRNLANRPMRSLLTCLGIAIAVASFIALIGISYGLQSAWVKNISERRTHLLAMRKGTVEILTGSIDECVAKELLLIEGVQAVAGELLDLASLEGRHTALLVGWEKDSYLWESLHLCRGHLPIADGSNGVVLGQAIAGALGKKPQDTIRIRNRDFIVTGTFKQAGVMGNSTIIILLPAMQKLIGRHGKVTEFNLFLNNSDNPKKVSEIKSRLEKAFPDLIFDTTDELADNNEVFQLLRTMTWSISGVALIMALVVILNTLLMSVTEQIHEIGILSAIGWQGKRILFIITLEGLLLSIVGSILGAILGIGALRWLINFPRIKGFIEFDITALLLFQVLTVAVILGALGSLYPAWRAIKLNPVDALRYE